MTRRKKSLSRPLGDKKVAEFLVKKKLFGNTLNNDVFVSGKHKVIFQEFKSGTTK